MENISLSVEENVLQRANARAIAQGTTVNALLYNYLKHYADDLPTYQQATQRILQIAKQSNASSAKPRWTRDSLHER